QRHANRGEAKPLLPLERARAKRFDGGWETYVPPRPKRTGLTVFEDYPLAELVDCIDWTPFFQAWELSGRFPAILDDPTVGAQARELYQDAREMLDRIVAERWLQARAVCGLWPAHSVGDDIELKTEHGIEVLHCLRQQADKPDDRPNLCLADFIAPRDSGREDWVGAFAVTAGLGIEPHLERFQAEHDDYRAILLKALADRLAEALAERLHQRVRTEIWGYAPDEKLDNEALIREQYRGIRPAPGYPACPEHSEKATLFRLLEAERHAGMRLTENFAMQPAAAVCGLYFSHPDSQYFVVGRLSREQVADYARRKGVPLAQAVGNLVPGMGVGSVAGRRVRIHLQGDGLREDRLGLGQVRRRHQQVAAVQLHHAQLAGVERPELLGGDVDALDLAAIGEMPGDLRLGVVQRLVLEELRQLRLGLAAAARLFLAGLFGGDAFLLLLLGAQGVGLGQVDLLLAARTALLPAMRPALPLAGVRARLATAGLALAATVAGRLARLRLAFGSAGLEAQAQQLVSKGIAHFGSGISNAAAAARCPGRRTAACAAA